jgi:ATP-dependent Zn protease
MVSNFGMGDKLEVFFNEETGDDTNPFLGRSLSVGNKHSQYIKHLVDKESLDLVREAYTEAKKILSINRSRLSKLVELLEEKNVVYKKDMDNDILNNIK